MRSTTVANRSEHRFVVVWSAAALILIALGFAPSWFLRPWVDDPPGRPLIPLVIVHGALFTGWLALFATQIWLAATGRMKRHRSLGKWAPVWLVALAISGFTAALSGASRGDPESPIPPDVFLLLPICEIIGFILLATWAWRQRADPHLHKRLMMLAIAVIIGTGSGRLMGGLVGTFVLPIPFILAIWVFDWISFRTIRRSVWVAGVIALACYAIPLAFGFTAGWRAIAGQMIGWWSGIAA